MCSTAFTNEFARKKAAVDKNIARTPGVRKGIFSLKLTYRYDLTAKTCYLPQPQSSLPQSPLCENDFLFDKSLLPAKNTATRIMATTTSC